LKKLSVLLALAFVVLLSTHAIALDCSGAIPFACGMSYTDTHNSGANSANDYCGLGGFYGGAGGEHVFEFTLASSQQVTIQLSGTIDALDLFLLASCDENDCLAWSTNSGTEEIVACLGPGTYYAVADTGLDPVFDYTIVMNCIECESTPTSRSAWGTLKALY